VVQDGVTGLLYKGDEEFLEQFARLAGDEHLRGSLGRNAREYILNNFHPSEEAAAYINLYRLVLGRGGESRAGHGGSCSRCMG
jgi:glycosyltransferase involved in cell wall biosynthesis